MPTSPVRSRSPRTSTLRGLLLLLPLLAAPLRAQVPDDTSGPLNMNAKPVHAPAQAILLDDDTIVRMFKAGLGDDILIQTIRLQPGHYDVSPDALISLKQAGLSDRVLSEIEAHGTGLAVRRNATGAAAIVPEPVVAPPSGVDEIGLYYKDPTGRWQPMETEPVHEKSSGWLKQTVTRGIVKQDMNGLVNGPEAKLLLPRPVEFLIYAPEGVDPAEYDLLRFRLNGKDREFRTLTGGVFHSSSGAKADEVPFKASKIATRTYTFTLGKETPGAEYGILPPGTGNATNAGKIYTFAISE